MTTSGTGFDVWAVCGLTPSASSICSAFPWSAVTRQTPPARFTAATTSPRQRVNDLDGLDDSRDDAGVADHVRVREVHDREAEAAGLDAFDEPARHLRRGHLRLLVVRSDITWRGDQLAGLAGPRVLPPAVQEVRHVGVFLRLRNVQLADACFRERLGERFLDQPLSECHGAIEVVVVLRHRRQVEAGIDELPRQLSRTVGTEVEEDRAVLRAKAGTALEHDGLDELVGDAAVVARLNDG